MATHSSILTRIIPWTKEPSGLQRLSTHTKARGKVAISNHLHEHVRQHH